MAKTKQFKKSRFHPDTFGTKEVVILLGDDPILDKEGKKVTVSVISLQTSMAKNKILAIKKDSGEEASETAMFEVVAELTVGVSDNFAETIYGEEMTFDKDTLTDMYENEEWLYVQVLSFLAEPKNFAPKI